MLREVLMKVMINTNNSKNQWDFVRETREKILSRIQNIEEGLARGSSQVNILREELKSMKKKEGN